MQSPDLTTDANGAVDAEKFMNALDLASGQDTATWVTDSDGKRLAALVPVEVIEFYQAATALHVPTGRHVIGWQPESAVRS